MLSSEITWLATRFLAWRPKLYRTSAWGYPVEKESRWPNTVKYICIQDWVGARSYVQGNNTGAWLLHHPTSPKLLKFAICRGSHPASSAPGWSLTVCIHESIIFRIENCLLASTQFGAGQSSVCRSCITICMINAVPLFLRTIYSRVKTCLVRQRGNIGTELYKHAVRESLALRLWSSKFLPLIEPWLG